MRAGRTVLGDLVPAMYDIPANPVMAAFDAQEAARAKARKGVGLFVPAAFNEPENPVRKGIVNSSSNALSPYGTFEGPKQLMRPQRNAVLSANARMRTAGPLGIGDVDFSSIAGFMTSVESGTSFGVPNYLIAAGIVALVLFAGSGGGRRR